MKKGQLLFDIDPIDAKTQLDQAQKKVFIPQRQIHPFKS